MFPQKSPLSPQNGVKFRKRSLDISAKEPYISPKEYYISGKRPSISAKEPLISKKRR